MAVLHAARSVEENVMQVDLLHEIGGIEVNECSPTLGPQPGKHPSIMEASASLVNLDALGLTPSGRLLSSGQGSHH